MHMSVLSSKFVRECVCLCVQLQVDAHDTHTMGRVFFFSQTCTFNRKLVNDQTTTEATAPAKVRERRKREWRI